MSRRARRAAVAGLALAAFACAAGTSLALPPPEEPVGHAASTPTPPAPSSAVLPFGSPLQFVLDDRLSSGASQPGAVIHLHLKDALVVNGTTVAAEGTKATMNVVSVFRAQSGDVDGAVQVHLNPLPLADGDALPVRAYHEYLTLERTAGQLTTRDTTDTIADIFVPGHSLYHAFRRGIDLVLPVGSIMRVETAATLDARNVSKIVVATPPPFVGNQDPPHSDLTPAPFYTPPPPAPPRRPKPSPTPVPSASATVAPAASASP